MELRERYLPRCLEVKKSEKICWLRAYLASTVCRYSEGLILLQVLVSNYRKYFSARKEHIMDCKAYDDQMQDIASRGYGLRSTLVEPFRKDDGSFMVPTSYSEQQSKIATLNNAIKGTIFEGIGQGGSQVAALWANTLMGYERKHGKQPSLEILAAAHRAAENVIKISTGAAKAPGVFEGVEMSTSDGIIMRDRLISLILPVYLSMITSNMVTYIPADFNQSEFIRIKRQAGSTFGDLKKGDIIDYNYKGLYTVMDQRVELAAGDGSTTAFSFDSKTKYGTVYPFKGKRTVLEINGIEVARDNGDGTIANIRTVDGVSYTVTGTVSNSEGKLTATISPAPANGAKVVLTFDVDIEKDPTLIPRLDHFMESRIMYPHESAVNAGHTIQALWNMRREYGQDLDSLTMQTLRNVLAADKDKKHLRDMYNHVTQVVEWERTKAEGISLREHYETVQQALLAVDAMLVKGNGVAGLTGLVAGTQASNLLRYLPAPFFVPSPDYRYMSQPHYVGRLWGSFDLYCDPFADDEWSCLCYARGMDYGQTAYIAGDAVPAQTFNHPVLGDLRKSATMWELAYRDMQKFDGDKYLVKLNFVEA